MLTGSPGRALLYIVARLSNTSNMAWPMPTTTRSWGRRFRVLLSRHPRQFSGLRLPQYRPALAGAALAWSQAALSPSGLARVGGVRMTRAGENRSSSRRGACRAPRTGECRRPGGATAPAPGVGRSSPGPARGKHATLGPPVKAQQARIRGHRLLGAPVSCPSVTDRPGPGAELSRVSSELRVLG